MNCEYCNKEFSNKSNLLYHQKNTKYCIKLRNNSENEAKKNDNTCEYCSKKFSRTDYLKYHILNCKVKKQNDMDSIISESSKQSENLKKAYESKIEDLERNFDESIKSILIDHEKELENLKESHLQEINRINDYHNQILEGLKSHSQDFKRIVEIAVKKSDVQYIQNNDNRIDNSVKKVDNKYLNVLVPFNLTREKVKEVIDSKFTEEVFYHGIAGLANLVFKELFRTGEGKYIVHCTDLSRKVFLFIDESGTPIKDYRAQRILELVGPPIVERNQEIIEEILRKYAIYKKNKQPDEETGIFYDENRVNFSNEIYQNNNKIMSEPNDFVSSLSVHCANIPLRS